MTYGIWFEAHAQRHRHVMEKLSHLTRDEVIAYFRFEHLKANEPDFCPLFAEGTKCHDTAELNCYFCACPYFRFCDEGVGTVDGKVLYSYCAVDAKEGRRFETDTAIHQDCSACTLPHRASFIRKHFTRNWRDAMCDCTACGENLKEN